MGRNIYLPIFNCMEFFQFDWAYFFFDCYLLTLDFSCRQVGQYLDTATSYWNLNLQNLFALCQKDLHSISFWNTCSKNSRGFERTSLCSFMYNIFWFYSFNKTGNALLNCGKLWPALFLQLPDVLIYLTYCRSGTYSVRNMGRSSYLLPLNYVLILVSTVQLIASQIHLSLSLMTYVSFGLSVI